MSIAYRLKRQQRKSLAVHILEDASVEVRAPKWLAEKEIEAFVLQRKAWIYAQQEKKQQWLNAKPGYATGQLHPYFGQTYPLLIASAKQRHVEFTGKAIEMVLPKPDDKLAVKRLLKDWYRQQAQDCFEKRLSCYFPRLPVSTKMPSLKLRTMKRRWGSCSSRGVITLNTELIKYPIEAIDYVIMHELCHLLEMNHSVAFYRLLESLCPDYKQREALLSGDAY